MVSIAELNTKTSPTWCPGCGNFGILAALKKAVIQLKIEPENLVISTGIGCSSKIQYWIKNYGFNSLHGRALPVAQAVKLANQKLTVIAAGGDGDGLAEGTNHFIHACKRNINITYLIHNNQIYGLTTGQASPTSEKGFVTVSSPFGTIESPLNICLLGISSGATFVARSFAGDIEHLSDTIVKAVNHNGFALVEILQPCVTYNKKNTFDWDKEHCYKLDKKYKSDNKEKAMIKAMESNNGNKIALGILYQDKKSKSYESQLPQLKKETLVEQQPTKPVDITKTLDKEFC